MPTPAPNRETRLSLRNRNETPQVFAATLPGAMRRARQKSGAANF